jgi:hypothetical protein
MSRVKQQTGRSAGCFQSAAGEQGTKGQCAKAHGTFFQEMSSRKELQGFLIRFLQEPLII